MQHFLPKFHLEGFTDSNHELYVYNIKTSCFDETNPKNLPKEGITIPIEAIMERNQRLLNSS